MERNMGFFDSVVGYETALWNHLDDVLLQHGEVSLGQLNALRIIHQHSDTCRVQEIREGLQITVGAASKLVDRLETAGLAQRRPNPDDRRSSFIALTPEGVAAHDAAVRVLEDALATHLDGADDGLAAVSAQLHALQHRLQTSTAG